MAAVLHVDLLGPGAMTLLGAQVRARSSKTLALLAYLAVEHGRAHGRDRLAALLWPDHGAAAARHSLRQALHALRAAAGGRLAGRLVADADRIRFVPGPGVIVDVHRFEDAASCVSIDRWREAADAYRAPLLDGRGFADAPEFEAWLDASRQRLHSMAVHNLDRLATDAAARGEPLAAQRHALRLRALDPAGEVAARHLMRALAARHESGALHAEWTRLCDTLLREYGVSPTPATATLYRGLVDALAASTPVPTLRSRSGAAGAAPRAGTTRATGGGTPARPVVAPAEPLLRAARAAERLHAYGPALDLAERALAALRGDGTVAERCDALLVRERLLDRLGRRTEQLETIDALLALARSAGDAARCAAALLRRANVCAYLGAHEAARQAARAALDAFRAHGDRPGEAEALREMGFAAWRAGIPREALEHARDALALHRAIDDAAGEASALHNLAELHRELGSPRLALAGYEQSLALHWAAGNRMGEILARFGSAHARLALGDAAGAMGDYEAALALAERCGERTMQSRALQSLAARHLAAGDSGAALRAMGRAIDVDRGINYAHALGHDLVQLAWIHLRRAERAEARAALQEALVWFEYTLDGTAGGAVLAAIAELDAGRDPAARALPGERIVSHLPLAEGKVYCVFESPLAGAARAPVRDASERARV
jgi:DNA-binding SARP family transcriptional activator